MPGRPNRRSLNERLVGALREYVAESERVAGAFAQRHGLHPTDLQALMAVLYASSRGEALSPGALGRHLGLSSGATTAVVDRLERHGHLLRTREGPDRRRITLRYAPEALAVAGEFFGPLGQESQRIAERFTLAELGTVERFLGEHLAAMRAMRAAVAPDRSPDGAPGPAAPGPPAPG